MTATAPPHAPPGSSTSIGPAAELPGRGGLVLETLSFIRDPFQFFLDRKAAHGPVFRTKVLGDDLAVLSGTEAMTAFLDEANVSRVAAHPTHVITLFGGINMGMLDGEAHARLRKLSLAAFSRSAFTTYLPRLQARLDQSLLAWSGAGELAGIPALKKLSIELICETILGIHPGPETDRLAALYQEVAAGMLSVPADLPWTTFHAAKVALAEIEKTLAATVTSHRKSPQQDGLSLILAARDDQGNGVSDAEMVREAHHMVIAGYIVFALLGALLIELHKSPELRARLRAELAAVGDPETLSVELLAQMPLLAAVVDEAKRCTPVVPQMFGVARRDFTVEGHRIPAGVHVWMALNLCNLDARSFAEPERFDPDRLLPPRSEQARHPHAWMPQGSGPVTGHRCLGMEFSALIAMGFVARLLRGWEIELPAQDLSLGTGKLPPEPKDGLRMRLRPGSS